MSKIEAYKEEYDAYLKEIREGQEKGLVMFAPVFETNQNAVTKYKGKDTIILSSNNYLGLADHDEVLKSMKDAIDKYGASVCGSRMNNGTTDLHKRLERKIAEFFNTEDALICNSGYMANLVGISGSTRDYDSIFISDSLNHASINDGIKLSNGKKKIFTHNNMEKLEYILEKNSECKKKMIIVDGVYSMNGDMAQLDKIVKLAEKYDAMLMVDEAHGIGVFGENGRGASEYFNVEDKVQIKMGTFSKSLGNIGGCIAASKDICEYMRFMANQYLFTVSLSPASVAGTLKAFEIMEKEIWRKDKLWENTKLFNKLAREIGFNVNYSESPIIPITIGDVVTTLRFTDELLNRGVYVCSAVFPVVPKDKSIIRITMSSNLNKDEIERALGIMEKTAKEFNIL